MKKQSELIFTVKEKFTVTTIAKNSYQLLFIENVTIAANKEFANGTNEVLNHLKLS